MNEEYSDDEAIIYMDILHGILGLFDVVRPIELSVTSKKLWILVTAVLRMPLNTKLLLSEVWKIDRCVRGDLI